MVAKKTPAAPRKPAAKAAAPAQAPVAPPVSTTRVQGLRARRLEAGLVRLDIYAHPDDHPALKALADGLARNRSKG